MQVGDLTIAELAYADDFAIISQSPEDLSRAFAVFRQAAENIGLKVNEAKTKVMHCRRGEVFQEGSEEIGGLNIERVESFTYLGSVLTPKNEIAVEVACRIRSATRAYHSLKSLLKSRLLSRRTKLRIYLTMIVPVLMYGSETWSLTQTLAQKISSFENNILKTICGPVFDPELDRWRRRYAREVRDLTRLPQITDLIRSARLRWLGHVLRAEPVRLIGLVYRAEMRGRRPRGRPRTRWKDVTRQDVVAMGEDPNDMQQMAENRRGWRRLVVAAKGLNRPIAPAE